MVVPCLATLTSPIVESHLLPCCWFSRSCAFFAGSHLDLGPEPLPLMLDLLGFRSNSSLEVATNVQHQHFENQVKKPSRRRRPLTSPERHCWAEENSL